MKNIHSIAFYALLTPAITLCAGTVLAEQSTDQDAQYSDSGSHPAVENSQRDKNQQSISEDGKQRAKDSGPHPAQESAQHDQEAKQPTSRTGQSDQSKQHANQSDSHPAVENSQRDKSRTKNQSYTGSAATNGMQASDLIGAEVSTSNNEEIGSVNNLIIDKNGQVVAIVVGVGGFLGMGEKDVAIGWDDVTRTDASDKQELRIHMTREELRSAPKFEMQD